MEEEKSVSEDVGPTGRCVSLLAISREGVDTRRCASKDAGPQRMVDLGVVPHRLEEEKSVSEDVGLQRGWIVMSHVGWGRRTNRSPKRKAKRDNIC